MFSPQLAFLAAALPGPSDCRRAEGGELDRDGALEGSSAAKDHQEV